MSILNNIRNFFSPLFKKKVERKSAWEILLYTQEAQLYTIRKLYEKNGLLIVGGGACPEQYDVYMPHPSSQLVAYCQQVAYYRLRHGEFTVEVPDCGGEVIYRANPIGDGIFDRSERFHYLAKAMQLLLMKLKDKESVYSEQR